MTSAGTERTANTLWVVTLLAFRGELSAAAMTVVRRWALEPHVERDGGGQPKPAPLLSSVSPPNPPGPSVLPAHYLCGAVGGDGVLRPNAVISASSYLGLTELTAGDARTMLAAFLTAAPTGAVIVGLRAREIGPTPGGRRA